MARIHPSAVIDPQAELGEDVEIGPGVVISGPVRIGAGVRIIAQAHLCGYTEIGEGCVIYPFVMVGGEPQDHAYKGERSFVRVGPRCVLREGVTIHRGTQPESETIVGADCMLMANSHVAHNGRVGDHVILVNGVLLAGHVRVGTRATIGGAAVVHQFVEVGEYCMVGGAARVTQDFAPFMSYTERNVCLGVNRVGLRRNNFSVEAINELRDLYRLIFRSPMSIARAAEMARERVRTDAGRRLLKFVLQPHRRGLAGKRPGRSAAVVEGHHE